MRGLGIARTFLAAIVLAGAAMSPATGATEQPAPSRVLETRSSTLHIVDDGDTLVSTLSSDVNPDTYVVHPTTRAKTVSYITDMGRLDFRVAPGDRFDFAIRFNGRLYNQRIATVGSEAPRYSGNAARSGGIDTIPFTLGPNHAIRVVASINGSTPLDLIFDTGASLSVLGEAGAAKGARILPGKRNTIRVGNITVEGLPMIKIDFAGTGSREGLIGFDSFLGRVVTIDYEKKIMTVRHDLPVVAGFTRLPITWRGMNSMVPMTIGTPSGARDVLALFDTGSRWSLTVGNTDPAAEAVRKLDMIGSRSGRKADGFSIDAGVTVLPWASIAGFRLEKVQADVEYAGPNTARPFNVVGNDFLRRFNAIIDYRSSDIYLKPNSLLGEAYNPVFPLRVVIAGSVAAAILALTGYALWRRRRTRLRLSAG